MKEIRNHPAQLLATLVVALAIVAFMMLPAWKGRLGGYTNYLPATSSVEAAEINSWSQAVEKIREERGEPTGKLAKVDIPSQLRHYSDTRRFLAVQVAEWRQHRFQTPKDMVDLASMIKSGEMVELQPVNENYVLFGVGGNADTNAFSRYENGQSIPLYSETNLAQQYSHNAASLLGFEKEIIGIKEELRSVSKRDRARSVKLRAQIVEKEKALKVEMKNKELLDSHYGGAEERGQLFSDYGSLEALSQSFPGRRYDIASPRERLAMKVRMLSSLRPQAVKVLDEIATSYRQKFERPLPITSLVRPDEYQHVLSEVNPNATRIETPPHSTGLAFDIYYRFMTAEEQSHIMAHLARLKDEGRIEVLRENRDHYHVFAFVDGRKPDENLISAVLTNTTRTDITSKTPFSELVSDKVNTKSRLKATQSKSKKFKGRSR